MPPELEGAGEIVRRQTTYWELRPATGAIWRVSFVGKEELGFAKAEYPDAEVLAEHPLLTAYDEPERSLYFSGVPISAARLSEDVASAIHHVTQGWRRLDAHAVGHLGRSYVIATAFKFERRDQG